MSAIRRFINHGLSYCEVIFDTTKLSSGSSASDTLNLNFQNTTFTSPLTIYWGDGTNTYVPIGGFYPHVYAVPGVYTVNIIGDDFKFFFGNTNDRLKIIKIKRWGNIRPSSSSFYGTSNLDLSNVEGIPILDTTLVSCFRGHQIPGINNIELWDVSNVLNMTSMFQSASAFNQDISNWNFNKDVILENFMHLKTFLNYSAINYSKLLIKLASIVVGTGRTQINKRLGMNSIKYDSSAISARSALVADGWIITDGGLV